MINFQEQSEQAQDLSKEMFRIYLGKYYEDYEMEDTGVTD